MENVRLSRWGRKLRGGVPTVLDAGAAILLSQGASLIYEPAGWITAGLALMVINWRIHTE